RAHLVGDLSGREVHRVTGDNRLATRIGTMAEGARRRIACDDPDRGRWHAEWFRRKLREHGVRALALRRSAPRNRNLTGRSDAHARALEGPAARALDVVRHTDSEEASLAPCSLTPPGEIAPTGGLQRAALALDVVAAVVGHRQAVARDDLCDVGH